MARGELIAAEPRHAFDLVQRLCLEDRIELQALGIDPLRGLRDSIAVSDRAFCVVIDGEIAALLGVVTRPWGGQFWLMTGVAVRRAPVAFIKAASRAFRQIAEGQTLMANIVDARHEQALRLARHFGFEVVETQPCGVAGEPFCTIRWEAPDVHRA
jgi:hypothetical protein